MDKITTIKINGTVYGIDGDASSVVGTATSEYNTLGKVQSKIESEVQRATAAEDTKADKATTIAGYGITDAYTKSETYNKTEINDHIDTPNQGYITAIADNNTTTADIKTLIDTAAGTDKEKADFIYRVGSWDGTQYNETTYSEYAWIDTDYVFLSKKSQIDEVFDISAYHANATYTDLAAALGNGGANVPLSLQRGGMSVKFVRSSGNKYVQYRLMADSWSTNASDWQGVDDEPTAGSNNLVKSGGVTKAIGNFIKQVDDDSNADLNIGDENGNVILQLKNGHIRTKDFNSNNVSSGVSAGVDDSSANLNIGDVQGNVILQLKNGHIRTKNFDSNRNSLIKFAAMGDSITSNYVTDTAGRVREILGVTYLAEDVSDGSPALAGNVTTEFGNLACGWSTCSDIAKDGVNITPIHLLKCPDGDAYQHPENVLSNQVRRLLQHTTPLGENIQWTHPIEGDTYTIDGATYGYGKGYTDDVPNIIYIASSTNDNDPITDDYDTVITQKYSELTRLSIASALRWAVETLKINYPEATIFVCTPIYRSNANSISQTSSDTRLRQTKEKREIILKICSWMGIDVIDQTYCSGIGIPTGMTDKTYTPYRQWLTKDGCHPNAHGKEVSAQFIAGRIKAGYGSLI